MNDAEKASLIPTGLFLLLCMLVVIVLIGLVIILLFKGLIGCARIVSEKSFELKKGTLTLMIFMIGYDQSLIILRSI